jgi:hypothetical protein
MGFRFPLLDLFMTEYKNLFKMDILSKTFEKQFCGDEQTGEDYRKEFLGQNWKMAGEGGREGQGLVLIM